ncbi:MAG: hypothetical protein HY698_10715 [Deltaproteobacteria bacterium]|nr:hypothetical protein [Deltaproteobacteria bacterium]
MEAFHEKCPRCGALVHKVAGRCKHCKADLVAIRGSSEALPPRAAPQAEPSKKFTKTSAKRTTRLPLAIAALLALIAGMGIGALAERFLASGNRSVIPSSARGR